MVASALTGLSCQARPVLLKSSSVKRSPACFEKGFNKESLGGLGHVTFRGRCGAHADNCEFSGRIPLGIVSGLLFSRNARSTTQKQIPRFETSNPFAGVDALGFRTYALRRRFCSLGSGLAVQRVGNWKLKSSFASKCHNMKLPCRSRENGRTAGRSKIV